MNLVRWIYKFCYFLWFLFWPVSVMCFSTYCILYRIHGSPLGRMEIKPVNSKGNVPSEELTLKLKPRHFGHLMQRVECLEKTLTLGKTESRRRGWQRLRWSGVFERAPGDGEGQGGLACCSPWGCKVRHDWATSLVVLKNPPALAGGRRYETWVWSLGWEDPLEEEGMATHSRTLAWRIPQPEEPGGLQSTGSERARHDWGNLAQHTACKNNCTFSQSGIRMYHNLYSCTVKYRLNESST